MCGLYGMVTTEEFNKKHHNMFITLGFLNQLRGIHSTGVGVYRSNDKKIEYQKNTDDAQYFYTTKGPLDLIQREENQCLVGHNRHATLGNPSDVKEAQPFLFKDKDKSCIFGVHNGTVKHLADEKTGKNDSHTLLQTLCSKGIQEAVKSINYKGSAALVWVDLYEGTLNMWRNTDRSLYVAIDPTQRTLMWASEEIFLDFVLERYNSPGWSVRALPSFEHIKIQMPKEYKERGKNLHDVMTSQSVTTYHSTTLRERRAPFRTGKVPSVSSSPPKESKWRTITQLSTDIGKHCFWCAADLKTGEHYYQQAEDQLLCSDCMEIDMVKQWITEDEKELGKLC